MFFVVQVILALTIQATLISLLFTCKTKETRHALNSNNCENPLKHLKSKIENSQSFTWYWVSTNVTAV